MRLLAKCFLCAPIILMTVGTFSAEAQETAAETKKDEKTETSAVAGEGKVLLKQGTEVHLKLAQTMTSKTSSVGEPVEMVLADDLKVGEDIVARKGARVLGTVIAGKRDEKQKSEAHELRVRADHIRVGDSFIKLTGEQVGVGKRDKGKMVTYGILFGLSGLLASSNKKFAIPEGTPATAYVQEDIALPIILPGPNASLQN